MYVDPRKVCVFLTLKAVRRVRFIQQNLVYIDYRLTCLILYNYESGMGSCLMMLIRKSLMTK